jgi:hypothetical protein
MNNIIPLREFYTRSLNSNPEKQNPLDPHGYFLCDSRCRLIHTDGIWQELTGVDFRDVEGTSGCQIIHPHDMLASLHASHELLLHGETTISLRMKAGAGFRRYLVAVQTIYEGDFFTGLHGFILPMRKIVRA